MADEKSTYERLAELTVAVRRIGSGLKKLGDPDELMSRVASLEGKRLSFRQYTENKASITYPFTYIAAVALPLGATNRVTGNFAVSQKGWFFADRIFISILPGGALQGANMWAPIARSNPSVAVGAMPAGADVLNLYNFFFEYVDGRTQQQRQSAPIPGDIFYRSDKDGLILPGGDAFGPNTNITVFITPTVATPSIAMAYVAFNGIQCHDVLPQ